MAASKRQRIAGWVLSVLISALLTFSAAGKFLEFPDKDKNFEHLGYSHATMTGIGYVEVIITILFLIPRTSFIGAILLTGYLGGATATHVRVGDPFVFPIIFGILVWIAFALRRPDVIKIALRREPQANPQ